MSESDVLEHAAAALRTAHDGQREGSGFTRARILGTLAERGRPRRRRWLVAAPFATLLLVGSAWAQSTGNWPRVWHALAAVLPFVQPSSVPPLGNSAARQKAPRSQGDAVATAPALPAPAESPPPTVPAASPTPAAPAAPARAHKPAAATPAAARSGRIANETAAKLAPEQLADPELRAFRAAHELHVQAEPRAAIDAYAEYLRAYPRGRFVPEARYNTALDWIKLGDGAAARAGLTPFADGVYGGYRQSEARQLLEALPR